MLDLLKKGLLTGIGLGLTTKEKVEEYAKKAAKEAKLSQEEGEKLLKDLLKQSEEAKKDLDKKIKNGVNATIRKSGMVSREEYDKMEKRVARMEKLLADSKKKNSKTQ